MFMTLQLKLSYTVFWLLCSFEYSIRGIHFSSAVGCRQSCGLKGTRARCDAGCIM